MMRQIFNTPKNHPKSKPFIDHVLSFKLFEGKIFFRCYQIVNHDELMFKETDDVDSLVLIEIGPRMTLTPIKFFEESLGGAALWQNPEFITPQKLRGKGYARFTLQEREKTQTKKRDKKRLIKEGKDGDGYIENAFN